MGQRVFVNPLSGQGAGSPRSPAAGMLPEHADAAGSHILGGVLPGQGGLQGGRAVDGPQVSVSVGSMATALDARLQGIFRPHPLRAACLAAPACITRTLLHVGRPLLRPAPHAMVGFTLSPNDASAHPIPQIAPAYPPVPGLLPWGLHDAACWILCLRAGCRARGTTVTLAPTLIITLTPPHPSDDRPSPYP